MQSTYIFKSLTNQPRNNWLEQPDLLNIGKFRCWQCWLALKMLREVNFTPPSFFPKSYLLDTGQSPAFL